MRIGYPCINLTVECKGNRTFRLKSYSEESFIKTVRNNLNCLLSILQYNVGNNILFFRITSDLVPFASHPICDFDWLSYFEQDFKEIGNYITAHNIRISMHPGQYTILNSLNEGVLEASIKELDYHVQVLNAMGLDQTAKVQLHVGGVYGNKEESMGRFVRHYHGLQNRIKKRLVIENDERNYTTNDCLQIHAQTQAPILFDSLHHELNNAGETVRDLFELVSSTWGREDGPPMVDYSSSGAYANPKRHAESINLQHFTQFVDQTRPFDCDIMLEIKNKEQSALEAIKIAKNDERFKNQPN